MDNRPIGVFDSGLGGASVLREALKILPHENFIYYGDDKNAPYGDKTEAEIYDLSLACADYLVSRGIKVMLLACNTATGMAIRAIREHLSIPVVSIEPAIKPACEVEGNGKILMLATRATTRMDRYKKLQFRMKDPTRIINVPCSGLVERIENGVFEVGAFDDLLDGFFKDMDDIEVDGVVLGCTHYVFISDAIHTYVKAHFRGECRMFDGNAATAKQLARVIKADGLENNEGCGNVEFLSSGDENTYRPIFDMLINRA